MDLRKWKKPALSLLTLIIVALSVLFGPEDTDTAPKIQNPEPQSGEINTVIEGEYYDTPFEVAEYIDSYGELPDNYLTKNEARDLGWVASEGNLWDVAPNKSIGGDYFGNFEELLPEASGRDYFEADIEYEGGRRNAKRLVFSNDGLYFYTDDHYETFDEIEVGDNE